MPACQAECRTVPLRSRTSQQSEAVAGSLPIFEFTVGLNVGLVFFFAWQLYYRMPVFSTTVVLTDSLQTGTNAKHASPRSISY